MTNCFKSLTLTMLAIFATQQTHSQGLQLTPSASLTSVAAPTQSSADFIVAVVNSEPITNNDVRREMQRVLQQFAQQRRPMPDVRELGPEVLESLINTKVQLQRAGDSGLRVEDSAVDQAEQTIAMQNQLDTAELRRRVERDGMTLSQFRSQLRDQIMLQRMRERDVEPRAKVSEQDIDQYLNEQKSELDTNKIQINLAQIFVTVPETASPVQLQALQARANRALERARKGEDFASLVKEFSEASDQGNGGQLGLRTADRYPTLFVEATQQLSVGDIAALVRSPAGFHILKVVEKINPGLPNMAVTQSHARHILLRPSTGLSEADARTQLTDFKKRIVSGQADFAVLARDHSQDGSAAQGGDLGWASPGMFVPEFEDTMNRLAPGEVSDPLVSRFGVHLIQMIDRRKATLSASEQREAIRAMLHDKKVEEAYRTWAQDLRGRAYVEMREAPQ
jgi:peptidyl-prolyl cis-trans isomerase SurA